jgi:fructokinase
VILVCGEALIDLTSEPSPPDASPRFVARPGGSPANVAVALGRLGVSVAFLGRLSDDPLGRLLGRHLTASSVDLRFVRVTDDPSTIVIVTTDGAGEPTYGFHIVGTASAVITAEDLPDPLPAEITAIHVGSISMVLESTASMLEAFIGREAHERVVVLDPNIRPSLIADPAAYRRRLRRWLASAHIVKASAADLSWLEPGGDPLDIATRWRSAGPALVIITLGAEGAVAVTASGTVQVPAPVVDVADTVGAGDAFTAGLLHALSRDGTLSPAGLERLSPAQLKSAVRFANAIAADTCTRPGADPPWTTSPVTGPLA